MALSGIAAENLESGSGIASRTIASLEHQWGQGRDLLSPHDVLVIDEAGMIGSRQMERVVAEAERHGAKVVLVGDPEQLQAIEAGAAFRSVAERHGNAGHVHAAPSREQASADLIERWDRDRMAHPDASRIILTHTNDAVHDLNLVARERLRAAGALGHNVTVAAERGRREFATGDRIMFLRNERSLGVKNGSIGSVQSITASRMAVMLDDGRSVAFDVKDYAHVDHGYAATIHKAQGATVDRVHVLATPGLDRHATYVELSRHRTAVDLHYGKDDFANRDRLMRTLSRERTKDMASDYTPKFADRRQIRLPSPEVEKADPAQARDPFAGLDLRPVAPTPTRHMFDGLTLNAPQPARTVEPVSLSTAVQRFARATADIMRMRKGGYTELPHQSIAFDKARDALNAARPDPAHDLRAAFVRDRG